MIFLKKTRWFLKKCSDGCWDDGCWDDGMLMTLKFAVFELKLFQLKKEEEKKLLKLSLFSKKNETISIFLIDTKEFYFTKNWSR